MSEVTTENNVPVAAVTEPVVNNGTAEIIQQEGEKRGRKRNVGGKRSNALDIINAEAELITKGLKSAEDVDGRRTTRSSTRGSTAASKAKSDVPPAKKEKKAPTEKGKRGRKPKVIVKENEEVAPVEENGITENEELKVDKEGSSTEEEVDSKPEEKIVENGDASIDEVKKEEEIKEPISEAEKPSEKIEENKEAFES